MMRAMFQVTRLKNILLVGSLAVGVVLPVRAQTALDNDIEIALVTFGPGFRAWEHFGHNALWVRQPSRGLDIMYNYGIFHIGPEGFGAFAAEFIRGRMLYSVVAQPPDGLTRQYLAENRSIWVQELNLTPVQRADLRDFLINNVQPGNNTYRYHYYFDNCSTRIRNALDGVLGGRIKDLTEDVGSGMSFRFQTQRLTSVDIPLYTGLLIGLANPVDREMSIWEDMFLPISMRERIRDITVIDSTGALQPLVLSERTINEDPRYDGAPQPPAWMIWYFLAGLLFAVPIYLLGREAGGRARESGFVILGSVWSSIIGTGGVILALLWAVTDHTTSYWNENLFFFNPFLLGLFLLTPLMALGVRWVKPPVILCARIVLISGLIGLVIQILPWFDQVNGQVIALVLPTNLALASGILLRAIPDIQTGS